MELVPAVQSIPLAAGIDTRNNPVLVNNERLVSLINAKFTKGPVGELVARNGYMDDLGNSILGGGVLSAGQTVTSLASEIDVICNGVLYAYSPSQDSWVSKGAIPTVTPTVSSIVKNGYSQSTPDSATVGGVTCYAWVDTRGGVWSKLVDQANGNILVGDFNLSLIGANPRVTLDTTGTSFVVWCTDLAGQLDYATASVAGGYTFTQGLITGINPNSTFDVVVSGSDYYLTYCMPQSDGHVYAVQISAAFSVGTPQTVTTGPVPGIAMYVATSSVIFIAWSYGNGNIQACTLTTPGTSVTPLAGLALTGGGSQTSLITIGPAAFGDLYIYTQIEPGNTPGVDRIVNRSLWNLTGPISQAVMARGVGLASRPFFVNGTNYILLAYASGTPQSTVQNTYFLFEAGGPIVGRYISLDAGTFPPKPSGVQTGPNLATPMLLPSGDWGIAVQVETTLESSGGVPVVLDGISLLDLNFSALQVFPNVLGADLTLSGGLPLIYDGAAVYENGFNVFPEAPVCTLLTSQIGMSGYVDGNSTTIGMVTVTFPINPDGSGNDGNLITAGEFIQFFASTTVSTVYFTVDGVGTAPSGDYAYNYACAISRADSAATVALKFSALCTANAINLMGVASTYTQNVAQVAISNGTAAFWIRPSLNRQFEMNTQNQGSAGSTANFDLTPIAGSLIQPGQYFAWQTIKSSVAVPVYCWFTVNGIGTDPKPFDGVQGTDYFSIMVAILSSYVAYAPSGNSVSHAIGLAINAFTAAACTAFDSTYAGNDIQNVSIETNNNGTVYPGVSNPGSVAPWTIGNGLGLTTGISNGGQIASYSFCAIYESVDAKGQLHRSAPSVATTLQFWEYGNHNAQVSVQTTYLRLTARHGVDVAFYATLDDGQLFYRFSSPTSLIQNIPALDYVSAIDNTPDELLEFNELMYSQPLVPGQVIPNNCPPAFSQSAVFQDQMWINDDEDQSLWWYSKSFSTGVAVEYSVEQTFRFAPIAGPTVCALAMDSNLIVFGATGIWAVNGLGPDSTGAGQPFSQTLISAAAGCRDPDSVVLTPNGIIFKSSKGFVLLDRGLQVHTDFGDPVVAYNADVVTSTNAVPNTNEIRFLSASGTTLLYDYQFNQWAPHSNQGVDAMVFQGEYYFLTAAGLVLQEQTGTYADNGTAFNFGLTSANFKPGAIQGVGRVWRVYLQGFFPAGVGVNVQIAYDYLGFIDNFTVTPDSDEYQIPFFPSVQECQSIQVKIADSGTLNPASKIALNSIDLELGVEKGIYKGFQGNYKYPQPGT